MAKFWARRPELLLMANVPKPLHGVNPRTVLGTRWWAAEKKVAYVSTNFHCAACGVHKSQAKFLQQIEGHESYEVNYQTGELRYVETVPLCPTCHKYIHDGRLAMLLKQGKISRSHYVSVIQHGDAVLAEVGLTKRTHEERDAEIISFQENNRLAAWQDWRLVIDTQPYMTEVLNQYKDKKTKGAIYIGRGSPWGNPYVIDQDGTREQVCNLYERNVLPTLDIQPLFGRDLLCFCSPQRCHGHSIQQKLYCVRRFPPKFNSYEEWAEYHELVS